MGCTRGGITNGRGSNFTGAILSAVAFGAGVGTGLSAAGFACGAFVIAGFALTGLAAGLLGFTVTFDVAIGFAFVGGRAAFFGAAAL
jgi:hypothetical protein